MLKNKLAKLIIVIIIFILIGNILAPSIYALTSDMENIIINSIDLENEIDDDSEILNNFVNSIDMDNNCLEENENLLENTEVFTNTNNNENLIEINQLYDETDVYSNDKEDIISDSKVQFSVSVNINGYIINTYLYNNIYYLFLPQGVELQNTIINYTGNVTKASSGIIDTENNIITNDFSQNNTITISANDIDYTIVVLQADLPSISISLNGVTLDKINSGSKDVKYKGNSLTLKTADNEKYDFVDNSIELKGRGNFSWALPKKSYQFKLSSKINVLGMGKAKTWLLIANYGDNSLIRNKLTYDLASEIGLEYTQNSELINLWIDGEYQGCYLLVEKVQVGNNRVELSDNNGLIVEMDNNYYASEKNYFQSNTSASHFVLKDSVADDEGDTNSLSEKSFSEFRDYINKFESYLYSKNKDWNKISSMIDVESFIKYYFIQEFTENADGARSSVFMYKDGANDVLHMGPVWDFDLALANCDKDYWGGNPEYDYIMNIKKYMESSIDWYTQLFKIPEFRKEVSKIYNSEIKNKLEAATQKIDYYEQKINDTSEMNFIRWKTLGRENAFGSYRGHKIKNTYTEEIKYLYNWVSKRVDYMNERYCEDSNILKVNYTSHVEDYGWNNTYSINGELSGTEGQNKRLEALKINLDTFNVQLVNNAKINYQVHVEDYGWMDWKSNGQIAGTSGEAKRIEAIKIKLENAENYSVQYRVHIQDIGWQDWKTDGEIAGTTGKCLKIEAIEIKIIEKINTDIITYTTHIQDIGWQQNVGNGNISGFTGKSLRLEGIKINLLDNDENIHVKYSVHIENIGWQNWKKDGQMAGTQGQCLRLEAIKIELEGTEKYNIKYRVHVQDIGWQNWKQNGEIAGTEGKALRLEAIQIKLEKK